MATSQADISGFPRHNWRSLWHAWERGRFDDEAVVVAGWARELLLDREAAYARRLGGDEVPLPRVPDPHPCVEDPADGDVRRGTMLARLAKLVIDTGDLSYGLVPAVWNESLRPEDDNPFVATGLLGSSGVGEYASHLRVVIPVCEAWDQLDRLLGSLGEPGALPARALVVLVGHGTENLDRMVHRHHGLPIRVVKTAKQLGFAQNCNIGARCGAASKSLVFLNTDTVPDIGSISEMLACLRYAHAVGPMGTAVSGFQDVSLPSPMTPDEVHMAWRSQLPTVMQMAPVPRLVGFALAVRFATFAALGGFCEGYGRGNFEDDDLSLRIAALHGRGSLGVARTLVYHEGQASFRALGGDVYADSFETARVFHEKRWGPVASALKARWLPDGVGMEGGAT